MILDLLTQTCEIHRRSVAQSPYGGTASASELVEAGVPCLVRPLAATAMAAGGRQGAEVTHDIYLDRARGLDRSNVIVVGDARFAVEGEIDFNSMGECVKVEARRATD